MSRQHVRLAVIGLAGLLAALPARGQSLGDLAKRTQEQRDKAKGETGAAKTADGDKAKADKDRKDKKVYTDQDLKTLEPVVGGAPGAEGTAASDETPAAGAASASSSDTPKDGAAGEAYWRGRWKAANERVTRDQELAAAARRRIDELTFQLRSLGHLTTGTGDMLDERQRLIAQEKVMLQQVAADKTALTTLQEEGRRAGAMPGWFR